MSDGRIAVLERRGVVAVGGPDAEKFLNDLVTADISRAGPGQAVFAALLTPQGKILFDFIVFRDGERFLFDLPRALAADFVKRLGFYKLRAKVTVEDISAEAQVLAVWGPEGVHHIDGVAAPDPRLAALGWRVIAPADQPPVLSGFAAGNGSRLRRPPHPARHSRRRHRLPVRRCLSARHRHGPAFRRRFRQGLLYRPGGGLAHGASRHRPPPLRHRPRDRRPPRCRNRGDRRRQGARRFSARRPATARWRFSASTARRKPSTPARRSWPAMRRSPCRFPAGRASAGRQPPIRTDRRTGNWRNWRVTTGPS